MVACSARPASGESIKPCSRLATDYTPEQQASQECENEPAEDPDDVKDCGSDPGPD
jgi:hypothetical protein